MVIGLGLMAGCITPSGRESDHRVFLWSEWTPVELSLLESVETYPVPYRILVLRKGIFVGHGPPTAANSVARAAPSSLAATFAVPAPAAPAPPPAKTDPPREQDGVAHGVIAGWVARSASVADMVRGIWSRTVVPLPGAD